MHVALHQRLLEHYLGEIRTIPLLKASEEVELAKRIKEGDQQALHQLVRSNLRFVVTVARKYQGQGLSFADLINEGNYGLIKAAQRFDETRGFKFISYAVWWVRQAILQALAEQSRLVRLPLNRVATIGRINRATSRLAQVAERMPTEEEIAQELDVDPARIREGIQQSSRHVSMDAPFDEDDSNNLLDVLAGLDSVAPDEALVEESVNVDVEGALRILSPREAAITRYYFGIGCDHAMTLEEIGVAFGVTRERARQIKENALRKLRRDSIQRDRLQEHV